MFVRPPDSVHAGATIAGYNSAMRIKSFLIVVSLALAVGAVGSADAATVHTAQVVGFSYAPDPLVVTVGDSVKWENVSPNVDHTATVFATASDPFEFDTGSISPGTASTPILMTTAGSYTVVCVFHGTAMRQQLMVAATPPSDVPEAPIPVLIGLSGLALFAGTFLFRRRQQRHVAG